MSYQDINRTLHAMVAYLHRYASELTTIDDTIVAIARHHQSVMDCEVAMRGGVYHKVEDDLSHVASELKAIKDFGMELEKKIQNSLALASPKLYQYQDRILQDGISYSIEFN